MIKSLIALSVLSALFIAVLGFSDIFILMLQIKGYFLYILSLMYSRLSVFVIFAFIADKILHKFLTRL